MFRRSLVLGAPFAKRGFETVAPDNPGHGLSRVKPGATPSYDDWGDLVVDFLAHEQSRDGRGPARTSRPSDGPLPEPPSLLPD
ncbi:hypothetical protein [Streptomyces sp. NPDC004266]|uniref:hypothetical protein n=1 Tax=Streptomyces sp. NPDC004266 TaxID=3364693 RepID=UPI003694F47B